MKFTRLIVSLLAVSAFLAACSGAAATPAADASPSAPASVLAEGKLLPVQWADLAFGVSGRVAEVLVQEGDAVEAGQVLARLEVANPEARQAEVARAELEVQSALLELRAAELERLNAQLALDELTAAAPLAAAQLRQTAADLQPQIDDATEDLENEQDRSAPDDLLLDRLTARLAVLQAQQDKARADLQALNADGLNQARLAAAQARLIAAEERGAAVAKRQAAADAGMAAAQAALRGAELLAPWSGTVAGMHIEPGDWVSPGAPLLALADYSAWVVETTNLTELDLAGIRLGQSAAVTFDALPDEASVTGTLEYIAQRGVENRGDVTYTARIGLPGNNIAWRWGLTAAVRFER